MVLEVLDRFITLACVFKNICIIHYKYFCEKERGDMLICNVNNYTVVINTPDMQMQR